MNALHAADLSEEELVILNTNVDAFILDEDGWNDATDDSGVGREMHFPSQWRPSTFDAAD